jgi:LDH2 family malate/lactate/ureidoglycolate dehydrogenase
MSFAGPDEDAPVMFDFATTTAAGGKVAVKGRRKEELPPGWIVDKDGNPSTRHEDFANGGYYMPFGLHKGYCLSLAAELLGSVFTGADSYVSSGPDYPMFDHQGIAIIAMRADLFQPLEQFRSSLEDRVQCIREVPPAPGYEKVLVPGDPERTTRIERSRDGIPFHEDDWQLFVKAAATVGCEID